MAGPGTVHSAGTAYLTVVPSFLKVEEEFKKQVRAMAAATDKELAAAVNRSLAQASGSSKNSGAKAGKDYGGAYADEAKRTLDKAWRALPEPQPGVNMRKWDKALAGIRQDMKELSEQRIGIDIDRETFDQAIADFRQRLETLRDTVTGRNREIGFFNADQAAKQLGELQKFTDQAANLAAGEGDKVGSAFTERMERALKDGLSKIPPMKLTADPSDAERKIAALRDRMLDLQSKEIGVGIDATDAYAKLREIQQELQALDRRSVRVDIRTNAHEAAAGMSAFIQQADQAGNATQGIGRNANFSMSRLEYLIALGASLGTAIVPAAAAAAAAVGMIGTMALTAVAGVGVFGLALSGVGDAVQALNGVQQEQLKSSGAVDQANKQIASSTNQVRMAQLALANTRRSVAEAAEDAARRVQSAEQGVAQARRQAGIETRNAAREVVDARKQVAEAEEDVAQARRQARIDLAEADRQVRDAQRAVTEAERNAVDVRKELNEAIDDARRSMEELNNELSRNELDQRKAVTAQMEALEELNKLKTNPRATQIELRQAQEAYDEQTLRLEELKTKHKELAADKKKYDKEGVEGDQRVIDARRRIAEADKKVADARERVEREQVQRREAQYRAEERISDAQDRVAKAQERVARAQEGQREAEIRGQERVAAAQAQVADARRAQDRQARDGQYQIQLATNGLTQAQNAQADAWSKAGGAGSAAMDKLKQKMAELSPEQQDFAKFIFGLKDELDGLQDAAAKPLLPKLEQAITGLLPYLPEFEGFVSKIASTMGDLAIASVEALDSPVWQRFFRYVDTNAVPTMQMMWETGKNLTEGLVSLYLALSPFNEDIGTGLVNLSRDFATWAENLNRTQGYRDFLAYVQENGPRVVEFLGEVGELLIDVVKAAAPLGAVVLQAITWVVDALNSIPDGALTALVIGIGAVSLGFTVLGGVMRALKLRQQLTDIFGPRMAQMVQTYAVETGRATEQTNRFGKALATERGMVAAAGSQIRDFGATVASIPGRVQAAATGSGTFGRVIGGVRDTAMGAATRVREFGTTLSQLPARVQAAATGTGAFGRTVETLRTGVTNTVTALSSREGFSNAVQAANTKLQALDVAAGNAATNGLNKARTALTNVAVVANGPGGVAAAVQTVGTQIGGTLANGAEKAAGKVSELARNTSTAATALGGQFATGLGNAATRAQNLARNAGNAATAVGSKMRNAVTNVTDMVGGFNIALLGATAAFAYFAAEAAEYDAKIQSLTSTLGELGSEYKSLAEAGKIGSSDASKLLSDIVKSVPEMREAVIQLDGIGVSVDDLGKAASGSKEEYATLMQTIEREIGAAFVEIGAKEEGFRGALNEGNKAAEERWRRLTELKEALEKHRVEVDKAAQVQNILNGEDERAIAVNAIKTQALNDSKVVQGDLVNLYDNNAKRIDALNGLLATFSDAEATAAQKADAMRTAIESQTGAVIKAIDADEDFAGQLIGLRDQINAAKEAGDKHATSLVFNTEKLEDNSSTALRNREALERVATSIREMYLQDIAAGKPIADVTKAHDNRVAALKREAERLGLAKGETEKLIKTYGDVDPKLETVYSTKNFADVYEELRQLKFIQNALAQGWSVEKAKEVWEADKWDQGLRNRIPSRAEGGPITGPGTGTSDSVLMWGSNGEFVERAAAVNYYGQPFMEAINKLEIPKDILPGYANGGLVGAQPTAKPKEKAGLAAFAAGGLLKIPMPVDASKTKIMSFEDMVEAAYGTGALGSGGGGRGWRWQMQVLRQRFPGLDLYSGYRPGSITSSGNRSWHGIDGGRAVDVPPRRDVFNYIHDTFGKQTKELIWGGDPGRNIQRGKHHRYSDALLRAHGPYKGVRGPSPHVHWAFDEGGWLPPGDTLVTNQTGSPEPVLNQQQWRDINDLAAAARAAAGRGGNTYQFEFRDTTLDPAQLRAIQDREAILARDDRAR